jgi:hypothetical protein
MKTKNKIPHLILAGLLGTVISAPAAIILQDNFDGRTISGGNDVVGNTLAFGSGWDIDAFGNASVLTSSVTGWSTATSSAATVDTGFRARSFSFTFTPDDLYYLTTVSIDLTLANSGGARRTGTGSNTINITDALGNSIGTSTDTFNIISNGFYDTVSYNFGNNALLKAGTEYTVTSSFDAVNFPNYDGLTLEAVVAPEPSSTALLGLGGLALALRRKRS